MKHRVILVRESPETLTCSNCAGTLEGIDAFGSREIPDYAMIRSVMDRMGELYLALRREFDHRVEIDVVDPRNGLYLIPVLLGDYRRYHPPIGPFLKTLFLGISPASVIVNGMALHVGELPTPDLLVEEVRSILEEAEAIQSSRDKPLCSAHGPN